MSNHLSIAPVDCSVLHSCSDGLAFITISAPTSRNALNYMAWQRLTEICNLLANDKTIRVIVLRGAGAHFCAGADIDELRANIENTSWMAQNQAVVGAALDAYAALPQPTVAIIQGACVGGGAALAFSSDFRIAASNLRLSITPARLGLSYRLVDCLRVVRTVGHAHARELLLAAREIDAATAQHWCAITALTTPENLNATADAFIENLLLLSSTSQIAIKANLLKIADGAITDDAATMAAFAAAFTQPDFANAARKFVEKSNK
jgi:enoyl-CoA hydratase/carnithine racemase